MRASEREGESWLKIVQSRKEPSDRNSTDPAPTPNEAQDHGALRAKVRNPVGAAGRELRSGRGRRRGRQDEAVCACETSRSAWLSLCVNLSRSSAGKSHISRIVEIQLLDLKHRLLQKNIKIDWNTEVCSNIVLTGYSPEYGARPIKRKIRSTIEDKISELIINNEAKDGNSLFIEVEDKDIKIVVKK